MDLTAGGVYIPVDLAYQIPNSRMAGAISLSTVSTSLTNPVPPEPYEVLMNRPTGWFSRRETLRPNWTGA
jgi:hypothetical protein